MLLFIFHTSHNATNEPFNQKADWVYDHFLFPVSSVRSITVSSLTVGATVDLQPQSHPPVEAPVGRNQSQESSDDRLLQFVLNYGVGVTVAGKRLDNTETSR